MAFQSRAGFSECLDTASSTDDSGNPRFNPVLGFLSVSTTETIPSISPNTSSFNPVLGFLSVSTRGNRLWTPQFGFNPVLGFLSVSTF